MLSHWLLRVPRRRPNSLIKAGVSDDVLDRLVRKFPQFVQTSGSVEIKGGSDSREFESWLKELAENGVTVPRDKSVIPAEIIIYKYQDWSVADIANALFLEGGSLAADLAEGRMKMGETGTEWVIQIDARLRKRKDREFGGLYAFPNMMLVRGEVKRRLESARLKRLVLKPMEIESGEWPKGVEPLYLIWSDYEMPPVANMLFDNNGSVFPSKDHRGPFAHGCLPLDGYYTNAQLRYHKADLPSPDDFDIAYTYERFGNREPCWRTPIVSHRFKAVCEELKLKIKWTPVGVAA